MVCHFYGSLSTFLQLSVFSHFSQYDSRYNGFCIFLSLSLSLLLQSIAQTSICFSTRSHSLALFPSFCSYYISHTTRNVHNIMITSKWMIGLKTSVCLSLLSHSHSLIFPKLRADKFSTLCATYTVRIPFSISLFSSGICFNRTQSNNFKLGQSAKKHPNHLKNYTHFIYFECHLKSFNLKNGWKC